MAGSFEANPPFCEELMEAMVDHFEVCIFLCFVSFLWHLFSIFVVHFQWVGYSVSLISMFGCCCFFFLFQLFDSPIFNKFHVMIH